MKKYLQKKLNNEKGMTLIELLAVIVIIAIIAAIAIPAISNIIENSRVGAIKSDAQNVLSAVQLAGSELNVTSFDNTAFESETSLGGYIEDIGSFDEGSFTGAVLEDGEWKLSAEGIDGGVSITFLESTKSDIQAVANNDEDGAGTVTIDRDYTAAP
ncbi:prepilin-type N-terminal cleavage/methylation domain-containing protein [Planococcus donghaensis]|uniref:prepilin-type N-terminal cleavage/methylation domain-containing protein n=1 Tax=Planococcus donghaensis TaxID=414778 RepID=UPI003735F5CA